MKIVFLISVFLFAFVSGSSQIVDASTINGAKSRLEGLQKELGQVDLDERSEVETLRRQSLEKGEFETTKQFEQRQQKFQEKTNEIEFQMQEKTGPRRDEIHRKMNEIFRTEFSGEIGMALGRYDADTQRFTLLTNHGVEIGFIPVALGEAPKFKTDFSRGNISGRLGLLLNADNKAEEYLISAQFSLNGKVFPVVTSAFTQGRAMQMLFGNYDTGTKSSVWTTFTRSSDGEDTYELSTLQAKPVFFKAFKENNIDRYLLVANTEPYADETGFSCHACSGLPSIAVFSQNNGYWKIEMALKHGGEIGGYGDPGTPSLIRVGPEKFAVKFSRNNGRAAMAEGEDYWRIDGRFPIEILSLYTSQDYDPDKTPSERISFRSTTTFLPSASTEFFDLKVTTVGKKAMKVGSRFVTRPFTKTDIYTFAGGKYTLKI